MIKEGDYVTRKVEHIGPLQKTWGTPGNLFKCKVICVEVPGINGLILIQTVLGQAEFFTDRFDLVPSEPVTELNTYKNFGYAHEYD